MKKTYVRPESRVVALQAESLLAASPNMDLSDEAIGIGSEIRVRRSNGPWSGTLWADEADR